jgi:GntR family transcriptional regulator, rspAB operon transcriptional repressor
MAKLLQGNPAEETILATIGPHHQRLGSQESRALLELKERPRLPTASAVIRQNLRNDILGLTLLPGQPIIEKEIAEAYGVSRTPVREALLRLSEEGLIDVFPQSGTYVSRIPARTLPEAIIIRGALEETSARMAAQNAGSRELAAIQIHMDRLRDAAARQDREQFHQNDEAFHAAIADAAGYPGIWRLVQQVKIQVDRYRRLTLPQEGRMARVLVEHEAVFDAIRRRDPESAAHHMGTHLSSLVADISGVADLNPDFFDFGDGASRRPDSRKFIRDTSETR